MPHSRYPIISSNYDLPGAERGGTRSADHCTEERFAVETIE